MNDLQPSFSLLDEPWLPCLLDDGSEALFGLKQIFAEAYRVRDIAGELPTQTFAIVRLLLAILHRTLGEDFEDQSDWGELWRDGLPIDAVHSYIEQHRERFDLLHPDTPFYQVAGLHTAKNEVKGVAALLFDVPSNFRLFTGRAGAGLEHLSFAEAARWLVHVHAYDVSGIHSGMVGDPRVRGGKGYGIGTGWAGELGGVLVEGKTLAETLVLNLIPRTTDRVHEDLPPWEREPDNAAPRDEEHPRGQVDLLTWQSRRIRLVHDGRQVVGCLVGNGDKILPHNLHKIEAFTAWRYSKPQTKNNKGVPVFIPRTHLPGRAFWRGITTLTVQRVEPSNADGPPSGYPPPVLQWLSDLQEEGVLSDSQTIAPRAIGVEYGTQSSVVKDLFDDRLEVSLAVFDADRYPRLSATARNAVEAADRAVLDLGRLAGNLALAAGGIAEGPTARAREQGFSALDLPFRRWLRDLNVSTNTEVALDRWKQEVDQIVRRIGASLVDAAGPAAWQGREVRYLNKEQLMTTSIADSWFDRSLRRGLAQLGAEEQTSTEMKKEDSYD